MTTNTAAEHVHLLAQSQHVDVKLVYVKNIILSNYQYLICQHYALCFTKYYSQQYFLLYGIIYKSN